MFLRGNGYYYSEDAVTRQQKSLHTKDRSQAQVLLSVKNQEYDLPAFNMAMARSYLQGTHPHLISMTWGKVLDCFVEGLAVSKRSSWESLQKSTLFSVIRNHTLFETEPFHFWRVLRHPEAKPATQHWLKRLQAYALDSGWLLNPVFLKKMWPKLRKKPRRAITSEEHRRIVEAEPDLERRQYYEMLWLTGGAQTDVACFHNDYLDKPTYTLCYQRKKMRTRNGGYCCVPIGKQIQALLDQLPKEGALFPKIRLEKASERARRFQRLCKKLQIQDVTLHCYRYALAERARWAEVPIKEAMAYLGHKRFMGHQGYAKNARTVSFPLEYYEEKKRVALMAMDK